MKLEILDSYNIRVRLSSSIILFSPFIITLFLCFKDSVSFFSSSVILGVFIAFTNYIPMIQRRMYKNRKNLYSCPAASLLYKEDKTFDSITKQRFYNKLAKIDDSFSAFNHPTNSDDFHNCCESATIYLKSHSRNDHLLLEENINYGLCKNLLTNKKLGILFTVLNIFFLSLFSYFHFKSLSVIPSNYWITFILSCFILLFWIFGVNKTITDDASKRYAKALIQSIDSL